MATLRFYTNPHSRGQIARWALHEVGADYEQVLLDYDESMKAASYLAINPMGKVPALVHDTRVVTECGAICAYLAAAFPEAGLAPAEHELADYYRWLFFAAGPVEAAVTNRALGFETRAEHRRMAGYGSYEQTMDVLESKLQADDYVCGERFTMADVYLGAHVTWGMTFNTFPERDSFRAYADRVSARPAYREAKAIDEGLAAAG